MDTPIEITRAEWNAIPRDYRGTTAEGIKSAFAACLPKGSTTETGSTLVPVVIVKRPNRRTT